MTWNVGNLPPRATIGSNLPRRMTGEGCGRVAKVEKLDEQKEREREKDKQRDGSTDESAITRTRGEGAGSGCSRAALRHTPRKTERARRLVLVYGSQNEDAQETPVPVCPAWLGRGEGGFPKLSGNSGGSAGRMTPAGAPMKDTLAWFSSSRCRRPGARMKISSSGGIIIYASGMERPFRLEHRGCASSGARGRSAEIRRGGGADLFEEEICLAPFICGIERDARRRECVRLNGRIV